MPSVRKAKEVLFAELDYTPYEFQEEFHNSLIEINYNRARFLAVILIPVFLILSIMDLLLIHIRLLIIIHSIFLIAAAFFLVVSFFLKQKLLWKKWFTDLFVIFFLISSSWMVVITQNIKSGSDMTVYLLASLCAAAAFFFRPTASFSIFSSCHLFFLILFFRLQKNFEVFMKDSVNGSIIILLAWVISVILFNSRKEEFLNKKRAEAWNCQLVEANKELQKANVKLKELDNLKSDFISTVSHEMRTPLTSILGFAKIIQKRLGEVIFPLIYMGEGERVTKVVRQVQDNLQIIVSEGERLTAMVNDVLDLSKMEAGKLEWKTKPVAVAEIINRAISATIALFDSSEVKVLTDIEGELPKIRGDQDRLLQVMINLISNAAKFTSSGSVICSARLIESFITVSVIDTGIGIQERDQEQIFDKFKQAGDKYSKAKGTGLGLAICKQIIERHGGRIWVKSKWGQGSNFSFSLPVYHGKDWHGQMQTEDVI